MIKRIGHGPILFFLVFVKIFVKIYTKYRIKTLQSSQDRRILTYRAKTPWGFSIFHRKIEKMLFLFHGKGVTDPTVKGSGV